MAVDRRAVVALKSGAKLRARVLDIGGGGMHLQILDATSRSGAQELSLWRGVSTHPEGRAYAPGAGIGARPSYGENVTVVVETDHGGDAPGRWTVFDCVVRWFTGSGFGVAFHDLDEGQQARVEALLAS